MAYQAKRKSEYTQDFELVDESGRVVHSMKVAIDPGSMVEKLSREHVELLRVKKEVDKLQTNHVAHKELIAAYETLGDAVIAMIKSVFGEEDTKVILEFYRNRYNDIIAEVMPFIIDVVLPDIRRISQENKREILQKYNRKQKRTLLKGKRWGI